MTGLVQVLGLGIGPHRGADGVRAVVGRDSGTYAFGGLDRDRERRAVLGRIVLHHRRQSQLPAALGGQRQADQATRLARHEIDVLGPHQFRGHDQITFVFAVLVVEHDDHAAGTDLVDQFGNRAETHGENTWHPGRAA